MDREEFLQRTRNELVFLNVDYELRENEFGVNVWIDVTNRAQKLFGDIVTKAMQNVGWESFELSKPADISLRVQKCMNKLAQYTDELDIGASEVEISFVNGSTVIIDSSEWGSIKTKEV